MLISTLVPSLLNSVTKLHFYNPFKPTMNLYSFKAALPAILVSTILAAALHAAPTAKPPLDPSNPRH